jgi:hypothetical protein
MLRVGLLVPPNFANLSFAPLAAFDAANLMLGEPYYEQHVDHALAFRRRVAASFPEDASGDRSHICG